MTRSKKMNRPTITTCELQAHCHDVGLEAFLNQLQEVFNRASDDTADFDYKTISDQYAAAAMAIEHLNNDLYPPRYNKA
jgi:hypothetical protein